MLKRITNVNSHFLISGFFRYNSEGSGLLFSVYYKSTSFRNIVNRNIKRICIILNS